MDYEKVKAAFIPKETSRDGHAILFVLFCSIHVRVCQETSHLPVYTHGALE